MKEIKAIVRPSHLHKIRDAFRQLPGFPGMNVSEVEGCSAHFGVERNGSLREELTEFTKKIRIEIVAPDEMLDAILAVIRVHAHTGQTGDGVLWVTEVAALYRLAEPPALS